MPITHNLGFPRIGANRELKFTLERYWRGDISANDLQTEARELRRLHWQQQADLSLVAVGDFSLYDQVLDMSFTLGHVPSRVGEGETLDRYFRLARGRTAGDSDCACIHAGEMTKWFDTNYHYIVPEFDAQTRFHLNPERLLSQLEEARAQGHTAKPVIIGPLTYLWLGKSRDNTEKLALLDYLIPVYAELLDKLAAAGAEWVQIDEPILSTELDQPWQHAFNRAYHDLKASRPRLLLANYFGALGRNLQLACGLPVAGLHVDAVNAPEEVSKLVDWLPAHKILSLGIINGRNVWKTDLVALLDQLAPVYQRLGERLWLAPSCSLLHVPVSLHREDQLDPEVKSWLAFALEKLQELSLLERGLRLGHEAVAEALTEHQSAIDSRRQSPRVRNHRVREQLQAITPELGQRQSPYEQRARQQAESLQLPLYPTTTIGSFPQTASIRQTRRDYRAGKITEALYRQAIEREIAHAIDVQEQLGLDVLVHGEAERNDMVEYFGEQLDGFAFSRFGWVQSYGSRCVKPPILYGDIQRPRAMTPTWIGYAQSLTNKPVKGMLTGPVTILNWSFVRDDQPRRDTCLQLALAIREEVQDLERAGVRIIQIDEAALREGLPLKRSAWSEYLQWAVEAFRISANGVADSTQIHTHMCYSEFNDIIADIARMDADVITIETSRSAMELLDAFDDFNYPNDIGPGVYDIHSPNIPTVEQIVKLMSKAAESIPAERLWVNPDCGLKTRQWAEVVPALQNMVTAAQQLRLACAKHLSPKQHTG